MQEALLVGLGSLGIGSLGIRSLGIGSLGIGSVGIGSLGIGMPTPAREHTGEVFGAMAPAL